MKQTPDTKTLNRLNNKITSIRKKIEKEKRNLTDSGFTEGDPMFDELFFEIHTEYMKDLLPFVLRRHKLLPYSREEAKEYAFWMDFLHDATLDKPPEEMLHPPARARR